MPIYDIFELEKNELKPESAAYRIEDEEKTDANEAPAEILGSRRDRFFSSLTARLFFFILLVADLLWALYAFTLFAVTALLNLVTLCKVPALLKSNARRWLSVKRSLICGVSLFITLFSPSFGIMIACTYFLMYDKSGIEEVVPSSLQSQFKEFLKPTP